MTGVKDEHTVKTNPSFRKKVLISLIAFFLVAISWLFWQIYAFNNAVHMAKEAGFSWRSEDPITLIRKDWRNALKKRTWGPHERSLTMSEVSDLDDYREMLHHLRPTFITLNYCDKLQNLDALEGVTSLTYLHLSHIDHIELQNVDALKNLTSLRSLRLTACIKLQNVDALMGLSHLVELDLSGCTQLQNVDSLKDLTNLQILDLWGCTELQNVDGLKNLTALESIALYGCHQIPAADLRELSAALPKTNITFPDGTQTPPQ